MRVENINLLFLAFFLPLFLNSEVVAQSNVSTKLEVVYNTSETAKLNSPEEQKKNAKQLLLANARSMGGEATTEALSAKLIGQSTFNFYATMTALSLAKCSIDNDPTLCQNAYGQWFDLLGFLGFGSFHVGATYSRHLFHNVVNPFTLQSISLSVGMMASHMVGDIFNNPYLKVYWDSQKKIEYAKSLGQTDEAAEERAKAAIDMLWSNYIENPMTYLRFTAGVVGLIASSYGSTLTTICVRAAIQASMQLVSKAALPLSVGFMQFLGTQVSAEMISSISTWGIRILPRSNLALSGFFFVASNAMILFHNASFLTINEQVEPYIQDIFTVPYIHGKLYDKLSKFKETLPLILDLKDEENLGPYKSDWEAAKKVTSDLTNAIDEVAMKNLEPAMMKIAQYQAINQELAHKFLEMSGYYQYIIPQDDESGEPLNMRGEHYRSNPGLWHIPFEERLTERLTQEGDYLQSIFCGQDKENAFEVAQNKYLNLGDLFTKTIHEEEITTLNPLNLIGVKLRPIRIIKGYPVCPEDQRRLFERYPEHRYCPVAQTANGAYVLFDSRGDLPASLFESYSAVGCQSKQSDYRRYIIKKNYKKFREGVANDLDYVLFLLHKVQKVLAIQMNKEIKPLILTAYNFNAASSEMSDFDYFFKSILNQHVFDNTYLYRWSANNFSLLSNDSENEVGKFYAKQSEIASNHLQFMAAYLKLLNTPEEKFRRAQDQLMVMLMADAIVYPEDEGIKNYKSMIMR